MSFRSVLRILGLYLCIFSLTMILPLIFSIYYGYFVDKQAYPQPESPMSFVFSMLISLGIGGTFWLIGKKPKHIFFTREIIVLILLLWVTSDFIGGLPFIFSKTLELPEDAFFESLSSITTTGASVMYPKHYDKQGDEIPYNFKVSGVKRSYIFYGTINPVIDVNGHIVKEGLEAVSRGILFWRCLMGWLGGLGIVLVFVVLFPILGIGAKGIFQLDVSSQMLRGLAPRLKETISKLWRIYVAVTLVAFICFYFSSQYMSVFDGLCLAFGAISTTGMTIHEGGLDYFQSNLTDVFMMIFMIAGSLSFGVYYYLSQGKFYKIKTKEFGLFFMTLFVAGFFMTFSLVGTKLPPDLGEGVFSYSQALYRSLFESIASLSTTGYAIGEYFVWPASLQLLILLLTFVGGMAGSTTGGLKISRHYLLFKSAFHRLVLFFRPDTVRILKIDKKQISTNALQDVLALFWFVVISVIVGLFAYVADKITPVDALGVVSAMLTNSGIGIYAEGSMHGYTFLSSFSKLFSCFLMLLGRLEYLMVFIIFIPAFWRRQ